jgi:hypothetical protein
MSLTRYRAPATEAPDPPGPACPARRIAPHIRPWGEANPPIKQRIASLPQGLLCREPGVLAVRAVKRGAGTRNGC